MSDTVNEYNRMYTEAPDRWDITALDQLRYEVLKPYGAPVNCLDIGCGSGHTIEYLSHYWNKTRFYGIDLSPVAVAFAATRVPWANIQCDYFENCILPQMDAILLAGTAEHFPDLERSFKKLRAMLDRNGIVYLEVPNCITYPNAHGEGFYKTRADGQTEWHLPRAAWETIIKQNGFVIDKSVTGPKAYNEFIWILRKSEE